MEKIDAVNRMLLAIRQPPVASLETAGNMDVAMAIDELEATDIEVQARGWLFNTEKDVTLQVDQATGRIPLPEATLRLEVSPYDNPTVDAVQRAGFLYDRTGRTYDFTGAVLAARVVRRLDWAELPYHARNYIALKAARTFTAKLTNNSSLLEAAGADEMMALAELQRMEVHANQANMLTARSPLVATNGRIRL